MKNRARALTIPPPQWGLEILAVVPSMTARLTYDDSESWQPVTQGSRRVKFSERATAEAYAERLRSMQRATVKVVPIEIAASVYDG